MGAKERAIYSKKALKLLDSLDNLHDGVLAGKVDSKEAVEATSLIAQDFTDHASDMGYPIAAKIAASLGALCNQLDSFDEKALIVLKAHTDTLRIIFEHELTDDDSPIAQKLLQGFSFLSAKK